MKTFWNGFKKIWFDLLSLSKSLLLNHYESVQKNKNLFWLDVFLPYVCMFMMPIWAVLFLVFGVDFFESEISGYPVSLLFFIIIPLTDLIVKHLIFKHKIACPTENCILIMKNKKNKKTTITDRPYWLNDYQLNTRQEFPSSHKDLLLQGTIYNKDDDAYKLIFQETLKIEVLNNEPFKIIAEITLTFYKPQLNDLLIFLISYQLDINKPLNDKDNLGRITKNIFSQTTNQITTKLQELKEFLYDTHEALGTINIVPLLSKNLLAFLPHFQGLSTVSVSTGKVKIF